MFRLLIGTVLALAAAFLVALIVATVNTSNLQIALAIGFVLCLLLAGILIVVDRRQGERRQRDRRQALAQPVTVHGPVGSIGQTGGHTSQVNIGHLRRTMANCDWQSEVAALTAYAGTAVDFSWNQDPEATAFAKEVRGLLQRAGWLEQHLRGVVAADPEQNVVISVEEPKLSSNQPFAALAASLVRMGVAVGVRTDASASGVHIGSA